MHVMYTERMKILYLLMKRKKLCHFHRDCITRFKYYAAFRLRKVKSGMISLIRNKITEAFSWLLFFGLVQMRFVSHFSFNFELVPLGSAEIGRPRNVQNWYLQRNQYHAAMKDVMNDLVSCQLYTRKA